MSLSYLAISALTCALLAQPLPQCIEDRVRVDGQVAGIQAITPHRTGESIDVQLTAESVLAWDLDTDIPLYQKNAEARRPVASLSKLLSLLTVRQHVPLSAILEIPQGARRAQLQGANVKLPIGEHVSALDLYEASLIASANDAMVTLALAVSDTEDVFAQLASDYARNDLHLTNTQLANATGLSGGEQYSTAQDIKELLLTAYRDPQLRPLLAQASGTITTIEGTSRKYTTTNQLLNSYLPIVAAKTGYTVEAGENLALLTSTEQGHTIGVIVLGSDQRFQDAKILVEWIERNYTWQ